MTDIREIPYFDGHCDTIYHCTHTGGELRENGGYLDLLRGQRYARRAQFFALFDDAATLPPGEAWPQVCAMHEWFVRQLEANKDLAVFCRSGAEIDAAAASGKTAALLSLEGADLIGCKVKNLYTAAGWGVRLMNPVWNNANALSGSCVQDTERGLSQAGRNFLQHMEALHILPDVSHISDAGFWDVLRLTHGPVVASHSNARALCAHPRNLTDDMFRALRDSGGVVGINLYRCFVGGASMDDLAAHIEHFLSLDGEKTVAIGGDLDGCEALAAGMHDVASVAELYEALTRRGYGEALLADIFWNNWRRVL